MACLARLRAHAASLGQLCPRARGSRGSGPAGLERKRIGAPRRLPPPQAAPSVPCSAPRGANGLPPTATARVFLAGPGRMRAAAMQGARLLLRRPQAAVLGSALRCTTRLPWRWRQDLLLPLLACLVGGQIGPKACWTPLGVLHHLVRARRQLLPNTSATSGRPAWCAPRQRCCCSRPHRWQSLMEICQSAAPGCAPSNGAAMRCGSVWATCHAAPNWDVAKPTPSLHDQLSTPAHLRPDFVPAPSAQEMVRLRHSPLPRPASFSATLASSEPAGFGSG